MPVPAMWRVAGMAEPAAEDRGTGGFGAGHRDVWGAATDPADEGVTQEQPEQAAASEQAKPAGQRERTERGEQPARAEGTGGAAGAGGTAGAGGAAEGVPVRPGIREVTPGRRTSRPAHPSRPEPSRPQPRRAQPPGGDLFDGLQRWLIRSSAKSMRREIRGQVRRTLGSGRAEPDDIWGAATTELPPDAAEAPECAWCPVCRAARAMRESGPGLSSHISNVSDAVATAVQDAMSAFDGVLSRNTTAPGQEPPPDRSPGSGRADAASDPAERAPDEPGDRG